MSKSNLLVEDDQEDVRLTSRALSKNSISNELVISAMEPTPGISRECEPQRCWIEIVLH